MGTVNPNVSVGKMRFQATLSLFIGAFVFLVVSEYLNALFNVNYDAIAPFSPIARLPFAFKPTVMGLYVIFSTLLYLMVMGYLKPLFRYLETGKDFDKARGAAIRMPWSVILFQMGVWSVGTFVYYALRGWKAESGIHIFFGILTKVSTGLISALYITFLINLILKEAKQELHITDIKPGENDLFSRLKDYLATIAAVLFVTTYTIYIAFYFASKGSRLDLGPFLRMVTPAWVFLVVLGILPIFLAKREYHFQIKTLLREMRNLTDNRSDTNHQIYLINFDELGELSVYVNRILLRFRDFTSRIQEIAENLSSTSLSLSSTSQQNSTTSNQQAAAVAEMASTMEDSARLSKAIEERADDVREKSVRTRESVEQGVNNIERYLGTMHSIRKANEETIEFIRALNEDIKTIWDVVRIINSIANQVKIIAFNAELEASSAGTAGKNFEIVATEIRRLADNTMASTTEIRNKITVIEQAAKRLIEASGNTTQLIESGCANSSMIQQVFQEIKTSSEETTSAVQSITENIRMQTQGFEQILITIRQIADGAANFAESTNMTSKMAKDLTSTISNLRNLSKPA